MVNTELNEGKGKVAFGGGLGGGTRGRKVDSIGRLDDFLRIYTSVKQVQKLIDFKASYIVKDGYTINSTNERKKKRIEEFFNKFNILETIRIWVKHAMIFGNGYLEYTGDQLIPREARDMVMYIDDNGAGEVVRFVQEIGNNPDEYPEFAPDEIILLKNNPFDHLRGVSELLGIDDIVNLDDWAMNDLAVALNRGATVRHHYTIGDKENPISPNSPKFQDAVETIQDLQPGEDLITTHEIKSEIHDRVSVGMDYKNYLEMINERMCMQLGVPSDIFFGTPSGETINQRRKMFEEAEITPRRRQIEDIINQEIIPRVVSIGRNDQIEFKFGHVNIEEKFIERKVDLIELQTGAKTPDEHRFEEGRPPLSDEERAAAEGGSTEQVPVSSRDETSESTIGGNLTGRRTVNE